MMECLSDLDVFGPQERLGKASFVDAEGGLLLTASLAAPLGFIYASVIFVPLGLR